MRKIKYSFILLFLLGILLTACEKESYLLYDTTQQGKVFIRYDAYETDSIHIDYGFSSATRYILYLPVRLMGVPADTDRAFQLEAVADSTTAVDGVHYEIDPATLVMPANSVETKVKITFYRDRDPELTQKQFVLYLQLTAGKELQPVGQIHFKVTYQDIVLDPPAWWWTNMLGPYSFELAQRFFEYYHAMADVNAYVYSLLVDKNGEYFEKATKATLMDYYYGPIYKNYIVMPLYEYYQENPDPAVKIPKPNL